ncbi:hypothetical protein ACH5RR_010755 [Cinchona calisaya]|uniref:Alcohol dehydrogenase-like N-terminal domain-containing protein n=1 Tax=Cinchona calisaya TaxID=153742 RepID=A0ABD3AJT7_9GENT
MGKGGMSRGSTSSGKQDGGEENMAAWLIGIDSLSSSHLLGYGHECAGAVEEVGSEVKTLVPGDRVAIKPRISCWHCDHCKGGQSGLVTMPAARAFGALRIVIVDGDDYRLSVAKQLGADITVRVSSSIQFLSSGKIDVTPLITHRFGFSEQEVVEALETSARGGNAIKVMFNL